MFVFFHIFWVNEGEKERWYTYLITAGLMTAALVVKCLETRALRKPKRQGLRQSPEGRSLADTARQVS